MSSGSLFEELIPPDQRLLNDFAKPKSQRLYQELVKLTIEACEGLLKDPRGKAIKAIVTGRVKKYDSLKKKLQDLTETTKFSSEQHLHEHPDMGDLAGVRIGLYFPDDVGEVAMRIQDYFDEVHRFGLVTDTGRLPVQGRNLDVSKMGLGRWHTVNADGTVDYWAHSGYESWQMVLQWKDPLPARLQELKPDRPPGVMSYKVEIQLGTVVNQAWAEVQHDIIYKKPKHILTTPSMKHMIDAVNGLAITIDIMLRELDTTLKRAEEEGWKEGPETSETTKAC